MRIVSVVVTTVVIYVLLQAQTPLRVLKLVLTRDCPRCRLLAVELRHINLEGADLRNADLRGARLESVNLNNADLSGANLRSIHIRNVTFENANFCGATLANGMKGSCLQSTD